MSSAGSSPKQWDVESTYSLVLNDLDSELDLPCTSMDKTETHGFVFAVHCERLQGDHDKVRLCVRSSPVIGCEDYSLLIDYQLTVEYRRKRQQLGDLHIDFELISADATEQKADPFWCQFSTTSKMQQLSVQLKINVRQTLTGQIEDLKQQSPYRDFSLLVSDQELYVNLTYLCDQGCELFDDWLEKRKAGVHRVVVWDWTAQELCRYMHALCTYREPVITTRYLCETSSMHPIRKLELAAEFGFSILGDQMVRELKGALNPLIALHDYASTQGQPDIQHLHPAALQALGVFHDYVII